MSSLFTPSKYSFGELMLVLKRGVTRADMQQIALEVFRAELKQRGLDR